MKARVPREGGLEPIIILGFGKSGKFENSRKIRTLAESVEALGVTPICHLLLTEVETQILNGSAQVRLAGEFNLSFKDNRFKQSMQNQFIFCCAHLRDIKFVKHF